MAAEGELDTLLLAVADADEAAFRTVYDRTGAKLFGIALRICRERPMAEEALQNAYADIWRRAASFDPRRGRAEAWLAVVARNHAIDLLRRHAARGGGRTTGDEALAGLVDPTQRTDGGVDYMALTACLGRLDRVRREAVLRAYMRGETREELAAHFKAPVNTVKTWLRRALDALRQCLEE